MKIIHFMKEITVNVIEGIPLFEEFNNLQKITL